MKINIFLSLTWTLQISNTLEVWNIINISKSGPFLEMYSAIPSLEISTSFKAHCLIMPYKITWNINGEEKINVTISSLMNSLYDCKQNLFEICAVADFTDSG